MALLIGMGILFYILVRCASEKSVAASNQIVYAAARENTKSWIEIVTDRRLEEDIEDYMNEHRAEAIEKARSFYPVLPYCENSTCIRILLAQHGKIPRKDVVFCNEIPSTSFWLPKGGLSHAECRAEGIKQNQFLQWYNEELKKHNPQIGDLLCCFRTYIKVGKVNILCTYHVPLAAANRVRVVNYKWEKSVGVWDRTSVYSQTLPEGRDYDYLYDEDRTPYDPDKVVLQATQESQI